MNVLAGWLLVLIYLGYFFPPWRAVLGRLSNRLGDWAVGFLLLPVLLAFNLRPAWDDLLRFAIFLVVPTLCLRLRRSQARPFDLFQVLAILTIWVSVETDLFVLIVDLLVPKVDLRAELSGFYLLPNVTATLVPGAVVPVSPLIGVSLALFLFLVRYPLEGVGFTARVHLRDLKHALGGLLAIAVFAIPVGLGVGFLHYNPVLPNALELVLGIVGGYLLIALVEEVLFRGIIQNLLTQRLKDVRIALPVASVIFGMAHLNNPTPGFAEPNWAYGLLATAAGLGYGWVWFRTRKVTVSAITHMLVNLIWGTVFH